MKEKTILFLTLILLTSLSFGRETKFENIKYVFHDGTSQAKKHRSYSIEISKNGNLKYTIYSYADILLIQDYTLDKKQLKSIEKVLKKVKETDIDKLYFANDPSLDSQELNVTNSLGVKIIDTRWGNQASNTFLLLINKIKSTTLEVAPFDTLGKVTNDSFLRIGYIAITEQILITDSLIYANALEKYFETEAQFQFGNQRTIYDFYTTTVPAKEVEGKIHIEIKSGLEVMMFIVIEQMKELELEESYETIMNYNWRESGTLVYNNKNNQIVEFILIKSKGN